MCMTEMIRETDMIKKLAVGFVAVVVSVTAVPTVGAEQVVLDAPVTSWGSSGDNVRRAENTLAFGLYDEYQVQECKARGVQGGNTELVGDSQRDFCPAGVITQADLDRATIVYALNKIFTGQMLNPVAVLTWLVKSLAAVLSFVESPSAGLIDPVPNKSDGATAKKLSS